jgi:hypothetical protein
LNQKLSATIISDAESEKCPLVNDEEKDSYTSDIEGKAPVPSPSLLKVSRLS